MEKEDVTHKVIDCAYQVYNNLGFGFLESVYRKAMVIEIEPSGLRVQQERLLKVLYGDQIVGDRSGLYLIDVSPSAKRMRVSGRSSEAV